MASIDPHPRAYLQCCDYENGHPAGELRRSLPVALTASVELERYTSAQPHIPQRSHRNGNIGIPTLRVLVLSLWPASQAYNSQQEPRHASGDDTEEAGQLELPSSSYTVKAASLTSFGFWRDGGQKLILHQK